MSDEEAPSAEPDGEPTEPAETSPFEDPEMEKIQLNDPFRKRFLGLDEKLKGTDEFEA